VRSANSFVTQITVLVGGETPILYAMTQTAAWARIWVAAKREGDVRLRQGAWYPVVSAGESRTVIEVSGNRVAVPQDSLELRAKRPDRFTVVYRAADEPDPPTGKHARLSRTYAVCPACASRIQFLGGVIPQFTTCPKCHFEGTVAWWETG
jgi:hypothetical protein